MTARRHGSSRAVAPKGAIDLAGRPFAALAARRGGWAVATSFAQPGPMQFEGPTADAPTLTLLQETAHVTAHVTAPHVPAADDTAADETTWG